MILLLLWLVNGSPHESLLYTAGPSDPTPTYNPWPAPKIIPTPSHIEAGLGIFEITQSTTIFVDSQYKDSLGTFFPKDLETLAGLKVTLSNKLDSGNIISFQLHEPAPHDGYALRIDGNGVNVTSGSYQGLVMGSTTILQALTNGTLLPYMQVKDESPFEYRGLMIDVARARHNVSMLYRYVSLCRFYKANFLHLHLTDDTGYTFPSDSHPEISADFAYKKEDLIAVNKYAEDRGVEIIGEIEMPCHCRELVQRNRTIFGWPHNETIQIPCNVLNPVAVETLKTFMDEVQEVFPSRYMHIGADECGFDFYTVETAAAMKKHNFTNHEDLYRNFIMQMYDHAKSKGKTLQVWEGFTAKNEATTKVKIPPDVVISPFDLFYYPPPDLLKMGYKIINSCWSPLYIVPGIENGTHRDVKDIFEWNPYLFGEFPGHLKYYQIPLDPPTDQILGSQLSMWAGDGDYAWEQVPVKLAAMLERTWSPTELVTFADFQDRYVTTNSKLMKLISAEEGSL